MTRDEALALPHAEPLLNGRCIGRTTYDPAHGTVLIIEHCECPAGIHDVFGHLPDGTES